VISVNGAPGEEQLLTDPLNLASGTYAVVIESQNGAVTPGVLGGAPDGKPITLSQRISLPPDTAMQAEVTLPVSVPKITVVSLSGDPVPGASVALSLKDKIKPYPVGAGVTDANGVLRVPVLSRNDYQIVVQAAGYQEVRQEVDLSNPKENYQLQVVLQRLFDLSNVRAAPQRIRALISWETNLPSDSLVRYDVSSHPTAAEFPLQKSDATAVQEHFAHLEGLKEGTTYYYIAESKLPDGSAALSNVSSFSTWAPIVVTMRTNPVDASRVLDGTKQETRNLVAQVDNVHPEAGENDDVSWQIVSGPKGGTVVSTGKRTAIYTAPGSIGDQQVEVVIEARSLEPTSPGAVPGRITFTLVPPQKAPFTLSEVVANPRRTTASVAWKTNRPGDSTVGYDGVSHDQLAEFPQQNHSDAATADHQLPIQGLKEGRTYYYLVNSQAGDGAFASSNIASFVTWEPIRVSIVTSPEDASRTLTWGHGERRNLVAQVENAHLEAGENDDVFWKIVSGPGGQIVPTGKRTAVYIEPDTTSDQSATVEIEARTLETSSVDATPGRIKLTLIPAPPPIQTGLADTPWPMFRHDPLHFGRNLSSGPDGIIKSWTWAADAPSQFSQPAVGVDQTIYVGSRDYALIAVNPLDGSVKWRSKDIQTSDWVRSSPAISKDGTIYIGLTEGLFAAVNPDGSVKWERDLKGVIASSPTIDRQNVVYICAGNTLYALSPDNEILWQFQTFRVTYSSPAVDEDGVVYIGAEDGGLYAVKPGAGNGELKWFTQTLGGVRSSPLVVEDTVYVGSFDHNLYAVDRETGNVKWSYPTGGDLTGSPAVGADGNIYIASNNGILYAVSPQGKTVWANETIKKNSEEIEGSPSVDLSGLIYQGSYREDVNPSYGHLYAISPDTGQIKWDVKTSSPISSSPIIGGNGSLYVGSGDSLLLFGRLQKANVAVGDLNGDGKVNVQDATASLRIAVGTLTPTDVQKQADDVNHDGKLNVQDTTLILRRAVGVLTAFP
jgi:outer membrane protein assembly factor BamB